MSVSSSTSAQRWLKLLSDFCSLQWQYSPENTVLAKRRRAKRAAQAAASGAAPKSKKPLSKAARVRVPPGPGRGQGSARDALSDHAHNAPAGLSMASMGVSEASTTDTSPDEGLAVPAARQHEALGMDTAQLPSQLPSQLLTPLLATQATATQSTAKPPTATQPISTAPPNVSDHPATSGHLQDFPHEPTPMALLPTQTEGTHEEPQQSLQADSAGHNPSAAAGSLDLPSHSMLAPEAAANPSTDANSGPQDVLERSASDSARMAHTQVLREEASKAASNVDATPAPAPHPETPAPLARAVQEQSPEPRAAAEGCEAVTGNRFVAHAIHEAYARSRSRSQDRQQQPRQLSVPNPFRISPEKLSMFSAQPPTAAQSSSQTPALSGPARAFSRSMSPEALHVMELGIADHGETTLHSNRSTSRSKSPEVPLLSAPVPLSEALPQLTAASSGGLQATVARWTAALAGRKPKPALSVDLGLLGRSQVETEQENVVNGSSAEDCSGSECRSEQKEVSRSPDLAASIMLTQQKLTRLHAEGRDRRTDAHQHSADAPPGDGHMHVSAVEAHRKTSAPHNDLHLASAATEMVQGVADPQ